MNKLYKTQQRPGLLETNINEGINPTLHTTTQADFKQIDFSRDPNEENILYNKLRRVNIQYGEHQPEYETANRRYGSLRNTMKNTGFTSPQAFKQDKDIENKLKQSYVTLGDRDHQGAFFSSTQKTFFNEKGKGEREPTIQTKDKTLASNFSIGGTNNKF